MKRKENKKKPAPTPRPRARRKNGDKYADGADVFEKFHGRKATKETTVTETLQEPADMGELGPLESIEFRNKAGKQELKFDPRARPMLCATTDETLYIKGGDQSISDADLDALGLDKHERSRHKIALGPAHSIAYNARKAFDKNKPFTYVHQFGEEGGNHPVLIYDSLNGLLELAGGSYTVDREGIRN